MTERNLRLIASTFVKQYNTEAKLFIQDAHPSGYRHLVVQYEGRDEFAAAIPASWSDADVHDLIFWPMKSPLARYPAWEVPARVHGTPELFRWWAGEKAS
jgi:hypothetical protein